MGRKLFTLGNNKVEISMSSLHCPLCCVQLPSVDMTVQLNSRKQISVRISPLFSIGNFIAAKFFP